MNRKPNNLIQRALIILFLHTIFANTFMLQAQINTNLPVGAIPGEVDVTPKGAATYTIPIEVVPGTQGMQPNLAIVYNSQGSFGLLGMKWDLAGISAITRCAQTPYFDGNVQKFPIQFTNDTRFTLDGERLIYIYYDNYFATEEENFTRYFRVYNGTVLSHFIAYTDDGSIIEFGKTIDSKQTMADNTSSVLSWYINKITDANGNYMRFVYSSDNKGYIYIKNINYTFNDAVDLNSYAHNNTDDLNSYANVNFSYKDFPETLGANTHFVDGRHYTQTKILDYITVSCGSRVRKYQFNYMHQGANPSPQRTVHLKEIELYGETDNEKLSTTAVTWKDESSNASHQALPISAKGYVLPVDFNEDGITDYLYYQSGDSELEWKLYEGLTNNYDNPKFKLYKSSTHPYNTKVFKADFEGNGKDYYYFLSPSSVTNTTYFFSGHELPHFKQFFLGDFNGDGKTDVLFWKKDPTIINNQSSFSLYIDGVYSESPGLPTTGDITNVIVGDFSGCRATEVIIVYSSGDVESYYCGSNNNFYPRTTLTTTVPPSSNFYPGDFNGDGITDLLTTFKSGNELVAYVSFGKGNGTYTAKTYISSGLMNSTTGTFTIADMNNDGKDDIIQIDGISVVILYSKGCFGSNNTYKWEKGGDELSGGSAFESIAVADCNGDGFLNLVLKGKYSLTTNIVHQYKDRYLDCVDMITDGLGKEIVFDYKPHYSVAKDFNTAMGNIRKHFCLVTSKLYVSNGIVNRKNQYDYSYSVPLVSSTKKTFLGFEKITKNDVAEKKREVSNFAVHFDYLHVLEAESKELFYQYDDDFYYKTQSGIGIKGLGLKRYIREYYDPTFWNELLGCNTETENTYVSNRIVESEETTYSKRVYRDLYHGRKYFIDKKYYYYKTIPLNGNPKQNKTVIKSILSEKYLNGYDHYFDTLTYGFSGTGKLLWERKGNLDGVITTKYDDYDSTGVYKTKTLVAAGCEPRTENYDYDDTRRFITKITNPLGHESFFDYDPKTGKLLSETDPNGLTTTYSYDTFGNLIQINYPDGTNTTISTYWYTATEVPNAIYYTETTTTGKSKLTVHYDLLGRELRRMQDGVCTDTRYNVRGEVDSTSYPYKPAGKPDKDKTWKLFTYDENNRVLTEKSPYTNLEYTYDLWQTDMFDNLRGTTCTKYTDPLGRIDYVYDTGGEVTHSNIYYNSTRHWTTIETNNIKTTIYSDLWGNRTKIIDPNAGTITSKYNGFNELIEQKDARGNITKWQYDLLGRVTEKKYLDPNGSTQKTVHYTYDFNDQTYKGIGKLYQIYTNNNLEETYLYDDMSRLAEHVIINNGENTFTYTYNNIGQLHTLTYPSGFGVKYGYHTSGKMNEIRRLDNNKVIYAVSALNKFYAPVSCTFGNNTGTEYEYNEFGLVTRIQTGKQILTPITPPPQDPKFSLKEEINIGVSTQPAYSLDSTLLNYRYAYDDKGLMSRRSESVFNRKEEFYHDHLDRLVEIGIGAQEPQEIQYHFNGNIKKNSKVGDYKYYSNKPHAVTDIYPVDDFVFSDNNCAVTYNYFNQPATITEGEYKHTLLYNAHQQRSKMTTTKNGKLTENKFYINKYYEKDSVSRQIRSYNYIYGDYGVVGLYVKDIPDIHENSTMYYIHTDHLGSYCAISTDSAKVVQRNIFDPWGNHYYFDLQGGQDTLSVGGDDPGTLLRAGHKFQYHFNLTRRGFTGHEHYPELKIINMNARLYDPVIARFFSPDNYVVDNQHTQDFNRYSYARNNPLMYTDPTGNLYNPIFDWEGTFLGTDDRGLKGEAIIMNKNDFKQNMSHNDALRLGTLRSQLPMIINADILSKIDNKVASFPSRPDWDGHLTLKEANDWYKNGNGDALYVDLGKINLAGIFSLGEKYVGQVKAVNLLFNSGSINDGLVHGNITLKRYPDHTVRAFSDEYNFKMHSWKNPMNWGRNFEAMIGGRVAGKGTPYEINFYGSNKLTPIFPWIK